MAPARVHRADVAQLVEQLTRNEQVSGSNPLVGSTFFTCFQTDRGHLPVPRRDKDQEFAELLVQIGPMTAGELARYPTGLTAAARDPDGKMHALREYLDTIHANEVLCED